MLEDHPTSDSSDRADSPLSGVEIVRPALLPKYPPPPLRPYKHTYFPSSTYTYILLKPTHLRLFKNDYIDVPPNHKPTYKWCICRLQSAYGGRNTRNDEWERMILHPNNILFKSIGPGRRATGPIQMIMSKTQAHQLGRMPIPPPQILFPTPPPPKIPPPPTLLRQPIRQTVTFVPARGPDIRNAEGPAEGAENGGRTEQQKLSTPPPFALRPPSFSAPPSFPPPNPNLLDSLCVITRCTIQNHTSLCLAFHANMESLQQQGRPIYSIPEDAVFPPECMAGPTFRNPRQPPTDTFPILDASHPLLLSRCHTYAFVLVNNVPAQIPELALLKYQIAVLFRVQPWHVTILEQLRTPQGTGPGREGQSGGKGQRLIVKLAIQLFPDFKEIFEHPGYALCDTAEKWCSFLSAVERLVAGTLVIEVVGVQLVARGGLDFKEMRHPEAQLYLRYPRIPPTGPRPLRPDDRAIPYTPMETFIRYPQEGEMNWSPFPSMQQTTKRAVMMSLQPAGRT